MKNMQQAENQPEYNFEFNPTPEYSELVARLGRFITVLDEELEDSSDLTREWRVSAQALRKNMAELLTSQNQGAQNKPQFSKDVQALMENFKTLMVDPKKMKQ